MNRDGCPTRYLLYSEEIAVAMMGEDFVAIQGRHAFFHRPPDKNRQINAPLSGFTQVI